MPDERLVENAQNDRQRPGGRSARVRQSVRRATLELLAEQGFSEVTLPAIARCAGVNKTTVYRWWSTPLELVEEALAGFADLALPEIDTGRSEGDVESFVQARLRLIRDPKAANVLRAVIAMGQADVWVRPSWVSHGINSHTNFGS